MSRAGDARRTHDLELLEAEFAEALALAKAEEFSAYLSEKRGNRRGAALPLDVKLFTLESKIERLREKLGLEKLVISLEGGERKGIKSKPGAPPVERGPWAPPPDYDDCLYPLDPSDLYMQLIESGRDPHEIFDRVKCLGGRGRQAPGEKSWRLLQVEIGDGRVPAKLALIVSPLPIHPDAELAREKLDRALQKLVKFCENASRTPITERPRQLSVTYGRAERELAFHAR